MNNTQATFVLLFFTAVFFMACKDSKTVPPTQEDVVGITLKYNTCWTYYHDKKIAVSEGEFRFVVTDTSYEKVTGTKFYDDKKHIGRLENGVFYAPPFSAIIPGKVIREVYSEGIEKYYFNTSKTP